MFTVYCLSSLSRKYLYVGLTENLERRFNEHQFGKNRTTKPYCPFKIIYTERFETRIQDREKPVLISSITGSPITIYIIEVLSRQNHIN